MALSSDIVSQFAKIVTLQETKPVVTTVTGKAVSYQGILYVQLDGSDQLTPIASSTAGIKDGDRVTVQIKNHSVTITGNMSSPSAGKDDIDDINGSLGDMGDQITEFEIAIGNKVDVIEFDAVKGRVDTLEADNVTIKDRLTATEANIGKLEADNVTINEKLTAAEAEIDNLDATKLSADIADLKYATIENLNATNADINNLEATYAKFEQTTTNRLEAAEAVIEDLDATYATIDFANIGEAAVENLFAKSGIIEDLVVSEGHITGELVGVTIKGDLIQGGTVVADKLVVKGSDGLYYKLNTDGVTTEAEQTEYNSLNGSVITAKSITATKIAVDDLVAFDATIGGFIIDENSIHTNTKASVDSAVRGIYLDNDGQVAFGDSTNYLKYYKDTDGTYKLDISAGSLRMASTGQTVEEAIAKVVKSMVEEFYQSDSATELSGGSWSTTQPTWASGKYIWRRTLVTYADNTTSYSPSETGVCITGNTGPKGDDGVGVTITSTTTEYQVSANGTSVPTGAWVTAIPTVPAGQFLWTRVQVSYSNSVTTTSYNVSYQGKDGTPGSPGADGRGISTTAVAYQSSANGTTAPTGTWHSTIPTVDPGEYLWTRTITTYTDGTSTTSYSVGRMGQNGTNGSDGADGKGIKSTAITYQAGTSQTTAPTGSWTSTVPTLSTSTPYLWTRTVITYDDNTTSTSYSVSSTLESFEVGGRNLVTRYKNRNPHSANGMTVAFIEYDFRIYGTNTKHDAAYGFSSWILTSTPCLEPGQTYTLSTTEPLPAGVYLGLNTTNSSGGSISTGGYLYGDGSKKYITFTVPSNATGIANGFFAVLPALTDPVDITFRIKLEKGNKATDWTPAPEDVDSSINDLNNGLSNANNSIANIQQTVTTTTERVNTLEQNDAGWEMEFNTITQTVAQLGDQVSTNYTEQLKYIKFINGEIWLGKDRDEGEDEDDFKVVISNERIRFLQNNAEIAYLSNKQLYITNGQILKRLDLGNFAFFPRDNGNLTFRLA